MHRRSLAGLNRSRHLVAKTVGSCLAWAPEQPYNWDEKLRALIVGICQARSLVLQTIAQTMPEHVKTTENKLSKFLGQNRLNVSGAERAAVRAVLKRLGKRRFYRLGGKAVMIIDSTAHAKARSRGKVRAMPGKGKVRVHNLPAKETILVPGYQEIWIGLLLDDRTVLPITRKLWSENGPECASLNLVEAAEIRRARELVQKALELDVILVADSGFRRKELLHWLKKTEGLDFVIRIEGNLTIHVEGSKGLLKDLGPWWHSRARVQWREKSKHVLLSDVGARRVSLVTESKERVSLNALCLTPVNEKIEPMFLATTLTTETVGDLIAIVRLYSWRWGIETYFWNFKNGQKGSTWRVFSSWEAIDRLLSAAHIAYLTVKLLAEFCEEEKTEAMRLLKRRLEYVLRSRFARPPELTLGRFFRLIAMDFPDPAAAGLAL